MIWLGLSWRLAVLPLVISCLHSCFTNICYPGTSPEQTCWKMGCPCHHGPRPYYGFHFVLFPFGPRYLCRAFACCVLTYIYGREEQFCQVNGQIPGMGSRAFNGTLTHEWPHLPFGSTAWSGGTACPGILGYTYGYTFGGHFLGCFPSSFRNVACAGCGSFFQSET